MCEYNSYVLSRDFQSSQSVHICLRSSVHVCLFSLFFINLVYLQTGIESKEKTNNTPQVMGMYERSKLRLKEREQKLKQIEKDMMHDCTFAPSTNSSRIAAEAATWGRLPRDAKKITPKKSNVQLRRSASTPRRSPMSVDTNSTGSSRIDKLYHDGVKRGHSRRGRTDKAEDEARRQRLEELQLRQCTFTPQMRWTLESLSPKNLSPSPMKSSPANIKTPPRKIMPMSLFASGEKGVHTRTPESDKSDNPPLRVVNTGESPSTPLGSTTSLMDISPLRDPSVVASRRESKCGDSMESTTEYGSI